MRQPRLLLAALVVAICACGDDVTTTPEAPETGELVVRASGSATAPLQSGLSLAVDAGSFEVGFVEMRISANADCTAPFQTVFVRTTPNRVDVVGEPEIGRSSELERGSYPCVALRISDFLRYRPTGNEGACVSGALVEHDFFRAGNEPVPWRDPAGAMLTPRGTRGSPVEDLVWVYISTSESAVESRGYAENQVLPLSSPLVVPGTTTFYWDLNSSLGDRSGFCETVSGAIGFR